MKKNKLATPLSSVKNFGKPPLSLAKKFEIPPKKSSPSPSPSPCSIHNECSLKEDSDCRGIPL